VVVVIGFWVCWFLVFVWVVVDVGFVGFILLCLFVFWGWFVVWVLLRVFVVWFVFFCWWGCSSMRLFGGFFAFVVWVFFFCGVCSFGFLMVVWVVLVFV